MEKIPAFVSDLYIFVCFVCAGIWMIKMYGWLS
ncbi:hypothetical protein Nmel_001680 [Mimus melanotis]